MRALDTNVLVRFVTNDDPSQAAAVERTMSECHRNREHLFLSTPVICELVWVLKYGMSQPKGEIVKILDRLIEDDIFRFEHAPLVAAALESYRGGKADFADYLIGQIAYPRRLPRHRHLRSSLEKRSRVYASCDLPRPRPRVPRSQESPQRRLRIRPSPHRSDRSQHPRRRPSRSHRHGSPPLSGPARLPHRRLRRTQAAQARP